MAVLETVRVKSPKRAGGVNINRRDFDPAIHELWDEDPTATAPATPASPAGAVAPAPVPKRSQRRPT